MMEICTGLGRVFQQSITSPREYLDQFCKDVKVNDEGKSILLVLDFDLHAKTVRVRPDLLTEANSAEACRRFLWVGNTPDKANLYATSNKVDGFFTGEKTDKKGRVKNGNTLALLHERLEETRLGARLAKLLETFYPPALQGFLDLRLIDGYDAYVQLLSQNVESYKQEASAKKKKEYLSAIKKLMPLPRGEEKKAGKGKGKVEDVDAALAGLHARADVVRYLDGCMEAATRRYKDTPKKDEGADEYMLMLEGIVGNSFKEILLATVSIDGEAIVDDAEYVAYLHGEKSAKPAGGGGGGPTLQCSTCGIVGSDVSSEILKKTSVKFFMTDKQIFASGLDDSFSSNFSVCEGCFNSLRLGEQFLLGKCKGFWAGKAVLFIPEITPIEGLTRADLEEMGTITNRLNEAIYKVSDLRAVEKDIEDLIVQTGNRSLVFHYIFHDTDTGGRPNKVHGIVKDVPPTRLREIVSAIGTLASAPGVKPKTPVDLRQIYYAIPVPVDKKKAPKGKGIIFDLFDAILLKHRFPCRQVVEQFARAQRVLLLGTIGFNLSQDSSEYRVPNTIQKTIMMNEILAFLESIGSLETGERDDEIRGETRMSSTDEKDPAATGGEGVDASQVEKIEAYWSNKGIYRRSEARAMFLLGTMVADVGSAQYKNGVPGDPILKKINFDGMNRDRIVELTNDVVERLTKYKVYPFARQVHDAFHQSFDGVDAEAWSLSPSENVFYIMSGFAYKREATRLFFEQKEAAKATGKGDAATPEGEKNTKKQKEKKP